MDELGGGGQYLRTQQMQKTLMREPQVKETLKRNQLTAKLYLLQLNGELPNTSTLRGGVL